MQGSPDVALLVPRGVRLLMPPDLFGEGSLCKETMLAPEGCTILAVVAGNSCLERILMP